MQYGKTGEQLSERLCCIIKINNKIILNAAKWSTAAEITSKLVLPITNMILARLLTPSAFGAVATINLIISFAELFADAGFQKYIIQNDFSSKEELDKCTNVAFWTNFVFSLLLWIMIIVFRYPLASMAGNIQLGNGVAVAGISIVLVSFSSLQIARYKRNFDFKMIFSLKMITSFTPLIITVPLAFILRNYWALVIGTLLNKVIEVIFLQVKSAWQPRRSYSFIVFRQMFSYSIWTMLESFAVWLTQYVGILIVGNILNEHYLGVYQTSIATVNAYMGIITSAIIPVVFSTLSRLQDDDEQYNETLFAFQRWIAMFVIPMSVGLFIFKDLATVILLGKKWMEASNLIGLWALTSGFSIVYSYICSEVYRSKGKPKIALIVQIIHLCFLIPAIFISAKCSYEILALVRPLVRIQSIITHILFVFVFFKISPLKMLKNTFPSILCSCVMALLAVMLKAISEAFYWNIITIAICILFYLFTVCMFPTVRKDVLPIKLFIRERLKK